MLILLANSQFPDVGNAGMLIHSWVVCELVDDSLMADRDVAVSATLTTCPAVILKP